MDFQFFFNHKKEFQSVCVIKHLQSLKPKNSETLWSWNFRLERFYFIEINFFISFLIKHLNIFKFMAEYLSLIELTFVTMKFEMNMFSLLTWFIIPIFVVFITVFWPIKFVPFSSYLTNSNLQEVLNRMIYILYSRS